MWPSYANLTSIKTSPNFCTHGRILEIHVVGPNYTSKDMYVMYHIGKHELALGANVDILLKATI